MSEFSESKPPLRGLSKYGTLQVRLTGSLSHSGAGLWRSIACRLGTNIIGYAPDWMLKIAGKKKVAVTQKRDEKVCVDQPDQSLLSTL